VRQVGHLEELRYFPCIWWSVSDRISLLNPLNPLVLHQKKATTLFAHNDCDYNCYNCLFIAPLLPISTVQINVNVMTFVHLW